MKYISIVFVLFISCSDNQQTSELIASNKPSTTTTSRIYNRQRFTDFWAFQPKQFASDTVTLLPLDSSLGIVELIKFNPDGRLTSNAYVGPGPQFLCGNGLFYLDSTACWTKSEHLNEIILKLNGGYFGESTFKIENLYKLDSTTKGKLILIKEKNVYKEGFIRS